MDQQLIKRCEARQEFINNEKDQMNAYKSDLDYFLAISKRTLGEVLNVKTLQISEYSSETETVSHITLRSFEKTLKCNQRLFQTLKLLRQRSEYTQREKLISLQVSEENKRKELEKESEHEERVMELRYILNRKDAQSIRTKKNIIEMEEEMASIKDSRTVVVNISPSNLDIHNQISDIKHAIQKICSNTEIVQLQTEKLKIHAEELKNDLDKFKTLTRVPDLKLRKAYSLRHTFQESDSYAYSDRDEELLKNKYELAIESTKFLYNDPKRLSWSENGSIDNKNWKSLAQEIDSQCKEKNRFILAVRNKILELKTKNSEIVSGLYSDVKTSLKINHVFHRKKKRKVLSNGVEYFYRHDNKSDRSSSKSQDELSAKSCFSSVDLGDSLDEEEQDSVFMECINDIGL